MSKQENLLRSRLFRCLKPVFGTCTSPHCPTPIHTQIREPCKASRNGTHANPDGYCLNLRQRASTANQRVLTFREIPDHTADFNGSPCSWHGSCLANLTSSAHSA